MHAIMVIVSLKVQRAHPRLKVAKKLARDIHPKSAWNLAGSLMVHAGCGQAAVSQGKTPPTIVVTTS
jgi:hypothetical protein